jgi:hypothetical protein
MYSAFNLVCSAVAFLSCYYNASALIVMKNLFPLRTVVCYNTVFLTFKMHLYKLDGALTRMSDHEANEYVSLNLAMF